MEHHLDLRHREVLQILDWAEVEYHLELLHQGVLAHLDWAEVEQLQVPPPLFTNICAIGVILNNDRLGIGTGTANQNGVSATGVGFANAQNGGLSIANGQGQASNLFGFGPQASGTGNGKFPRFPTFFFQYLTFKIYFSIVRCFIRQIKISSLSII